MPSADASAEVKYKASTGERLTIVLPARLVTPRMPSHVQSTKVAPFALTCESSARLRSQLRNTAPLRSAPTKSAPCRRQSANSTRVKDGLGRIAAGATADLVWLGDDLSARATWLGGRLAYGTLPVGEVSPSDHAADRVRP